MQRKLAFILFKWFPFGGLQQDLVRIMYSCRQRGARVTVFCMTWQGDRPDGVTVVELPGKGPGKTRRRQHFVDQVRERTRNGFDLTVGFNKLPSLDYYFAADFCFARKAYEERSFLYRLAPRSRQYLAYEDAVFGRNASTRIMLISDSQKEDYTGIYDTQPERLIELPPGIDRSRMAPADAADVREQFRKDFDIRPGHLLVLQIGSGFRIKGVDRSLRALAALPASLKSRLRYFLVGADDVEPYRRLAKRLGLSEQLTSFDGRDDIPRFLQGADLLLHPAYRESAGMIILEAIIAGLPVLTTDTCGFASHVARAGAGHVCRSPFRQEELNACLADMLTSEKRETWRLNGIKYGRREDLYSMADKVADILTA